MKLVGATDWFVRVPFLIEGAMQGVFGAGLALGLLYGLFRAAQAHAGDLVGSLLGEQALVFLPATVTLYLAAGGVALGLLGSSTAVGRHLKV
jgi:cell division transport system permease protein